MKLNNKIALVTGSTRGIDVATASALAGDRCSRRLTRFRGPADRSPTSVPSAMPVHKPPATR